MVRGHKEEIIPLPKNVLCAVSVMQVKVDDRVGYSESSPPRYNVRLADTGREFNRIRYAEDFHLLPVEKDDRVYRWTDQDGTVVFSDNPTQMPKKR